MKGVTRAPGIYIHIPFCLRKCNYCAFLSFNATDSEKEAYVQALIKEIELRAQLLTASEGTVRIFDTVYFGGGTPTALDDEQLRRILDAVYKNYSIDGDAEVTLEANPGTVSYERLKVLRSAGFNRLSMGVQSMNDARLKFMGRIHDRTRVIEDYKAARKAGFDNINLDVIFSVPGESTEDALTDIREIAALGPEHISFYSLQLEEGTPFYESWQNCEFEVVPEEDDRDTYHRGCSLLKELGYEQYEISNFSKPGYESRHNSKYWNMAEYLGIGLGASGFLDGVRYKNDSDFSSYRARLQCGESVQCEEHRNALHDNISEAVFTGLRRNRGIKYAELGEICGECSTYEEFWEYYADVRDEAQAYAGDGFLVIDEEGMSLTKPGMDISNRIMAEFV